jgi:GNAT superfamily N-acetyltransferase
MAVDPAHQGRGVGTALTEFGVDRLRELGMTYAIVGTSDDPGHGPARQVYLKGGFEPMAIQPMHLTQRL